MRVACTLLFAVSGVAVAGEPIDPNTLAVPAEATVRAKRLIARFEDDDLVVRNEATSELKAMGREALPALLTARKSDPSAETRNRLAELLPLAWKADFEARYPLFLADKAHKYPHDGLLGWDQLKAAVKDTKASRLLFADILNDKECRNMLLLATDPNAAPAFEKRWEDKYKEWCAVNGGTIGSRPKPEDPIHWWPAAMLAEQIHGRDYQNGYRHSTVRSFIWDTDEGLRARAGEGRYGTAVRDLMRNWIESQTEVQSLTDAYAMSKYMKFDTEVGNRCWEQLLGIFIRTGENTGALGHLASLRDPKYIPQFRRLFENESIYRPANPQRQQVEIQVRDAALSMCIAVSGQDPTEYGFSATLSYNVNKVFRYVDTNYSFEDGGGLSAEEKRMKAFKKWAEWEKAHPEVIEAKPPVKK